MVMSSYSRIAFAIMALAAVTVNAAKPKVSIRFPKDGATFPDGQTQTYVMGNVIPPSAAVTCNGEPVAVHPKTGGFVFMRELQYGVNRIELVSGDVSAVCTVKRQLPVPKAASAISPYTLREPTGVMTGESVRLVCLTLPGRKVYAKVGKESIQLQESADHPGTYSASRAWKNTTEKPLPVSYYGNGLETAEAGTLEVRNEWPNCEVNGPRYEVRFRSLPGDGDTLGFPETGLVLKTTGYSGNHIRCRVGDRDYWIARDYTRTAEGKPAVNEIPDPSTGFAPYPAAGKKPRDILVVIDPGHGGSDTGAIGPTGRMEKDANLLQATAIGKALKKAGFKVEYTRTKDVAVGLYERVRLAVKHHADAFISVHHNATAASTDPREVRHFISFGWNERGLGLAAALHPGIAAVSGVSDRGVRPNSLAVCRNPAVPSCLIEFDFINEPEGEYEIFNNTSRRKAYADAVVKGMLQWLGTAEREKKAAEK